MHFKDTNNNLHFLDDASFTHLLPSDCVKITDKEAEAIRQSKIVPPTYAELRAAEYPPTSMYLDAIVKGDEVQKQAYIDACLAIKTKYPKPQ